MKKIAIISIGKDGAMKAQIVEAGSHDKHLKKPGQYIICDVVTVSKEEKEEAKQEEADNKEFE